MGMQGSLHDMGVADLIQINCQERRTACALIDYGTKTGELYFKDGNVVHASWNGQEGEEAVYQILGLEDGTFNLEVGVEPPANSINRSWSGLLMEGARRLDENQLFESTTSMEPENRTMATKLDDTLKEMSGEITGYLGSVVVGMDGLCVAQNVKTKMDPESVSAQMTLLLKLVDTTMTKIGGGAVEDNLLTTSNAFILLRYLPGKQYFVGVTVDRKASNLGNLRLITKMYTDRIDKAMPR